MSNEKFSQEFLNAFVDDQLAPEEKSRAYDEINRDETLNRQVCELRKVRDLVQLAYKEAPGAPQTAPDRARWRRLGGIAASVTLGLGVAFGWAFYPSSRTNESSAVAVEPVAPSTNAKVAATAAAKKPVVVAALKPHDVKILIHVHEGDRDYQRKSLDEIEALVRHYRKAKVNARIEVVMNGTGLSMARIDTSAFPERIARMQLEYDNLVFEACQNTIDRLKRDEGVVAILLPGVSVIDSGVAQLQRRQNQGWAYIQV
jgi:hypothetical protein